MGTSSAGRINLPMGMILRCLPPEVLASDISEFEASGAAATEIGLPMNMILSQLPSGKVEMALQDLIAHFPAGYLQPTESIASYLPNLINLPLMDVVMRIPPDLLSLRPDQKDVDASVINMADPFTEEILREQAEAARRQTQTNIIDESQVPATEEFVPRDQAVPAKVAVPPPRPPSIALPSARPTPPIPTPVATPTPTPTPAAASSVPPMPQAAKLPTPPAFSRSGGIPLTPTTARTNSPVPPSAPNVTSRTISHSGRLPAPSRATTPIPARAPAGETAQTPPVPPSNPPTSPMPVAVRHTMSLPSLRPPGISPTPAVPTLPKSTIAAPQALDQSAEVEAETPLLVPAEAPEEAPVAAAPEPEEPEPAPVPSQPTDELQRLAALAMEQLGDDAEEPAPEVATEASSEEPEPAPEAAPEPEPVPVVAEQPPEAAQPPPATAPLPAPTLRPMAVPPAQATPGGSFRATSSLPPLSAPSVQPKPEPQPTPAPSPAPDAASTAVALNLNSCGSEELLQIPGCSRELAESIIRHRSKIGSFKKLEDLLDVAGMTKEAYSNLTGEAPPGNIPQTLNELLGFPAGQEISLKDVTDRISCWPDVTGCILSQSSGLSLVGTVPAAFDKAAIVAFAPRMFESINKSFAEIAGKQTDELIIPTTGTSFNIFRNKDLYLIILSRLPQMPDRHLKVARFVLAGLNIGPT